MLNFTAELAEAPAAMAGPGAGGDPENITAGTMHLARPEGENVRTNVHFEGGRLRQFRDTAMQLAERPARTVDAADLLSASTMPQRHGRKYRPGSQHRRGLRPCCNGEKTGHNDGYPTSL